MFRCQTVHREIKTAARRNRAIEGDLLASDVSYVLAYSRCSVVVLRNVVPKCGKLHFCVPVDLTKVSEKALYDALLMSGEGDKISIIHVYFGRS